MMMKRAFAGALLLVAAVSCGGEDPPKMMTREQLLDPENCKDCHPKHYDEWSASMHAYASRDPVFVAMNKRMQEQAPENGNFCVNCHAPMAVAEGKVTNLADPSTIDKPLQGVTCYFCHNVVDVKEEQPFNNGLVLAKDTIMRGALGNPAASAAPHGVMPTSKWHDRTRIESSKMCGSCHDIQVPSGKRIERTFEEYMMSLSSKPGAGQFNSCSVCHMRAKLDEEQAAVVDGAGQRAVHSHLFPAVDVALTPDLPNQDAMRAAVDIELQACTLGMFEIVLTDWRPGEPFRFKVQLEHTAGHSVPSGSAQDRRLWLELVATDENGQVVLETGRIADGEVEEKPETDPKYDPQFKPWRDRLIDKNGKETHMFWEAADYESDLMPFAVNPATSHTAERTIQTNRPMVKPPAKIEGWVRLRPMGVDVLLDLVKSGHLDPAIIDKMPTHTLDHRIFTYDAAKQGYVGQPLIDADCYAAQSLSDLVQKGPATTSPPATMAPAQTGQAGQAAPAQM